MAFKFTDYVFTLGDLYEVVLSVASNINLRNSVGVSALVLVFILLKGIVGWQTDSSLLVIFVAALFYWDMDFRVSIAFGLVSLISYPFLLFLIDKEVVFLNNNWENRIAVWVYFFLIVGVIKQIREYVKKEEPCLERVYEYEEEPMPPDNYQDDAEALRSGYVLDLRKIKNGK